MPNDRHDDSAELMAAMARGDRRALQRLIARHGGALTQVATRYLGTSEDADEVVQDVFLRAWRRADRYDPSKARVSTWLYRIAVNLCIDRHRKRAFWRFVGLEDDATEVADAQPTAFDRLDAGQRLAQMRTAIGDLPNRQRMAILLKAVAELDTAQIAEAMGISAGAVEQLLVRARKALRKASPDEKGRNG